MRRPPGGTPARRRPAAGPRGSAWSLASYLKLEPIEPIVSTIADNSAHTWNRVEVFYSNTTRGNLAELVQIHNLQTGPGIETLISLLYGA